MARPSYVRLSEDYERSASERGPGGLARAGPGAEHPEGPWLLEVHSFGVDERDGVGGGAVQDLDHPSLGQVDVLRVGKGQL